MLIALPPYKTAPAAGKQTGATDNPGEESLAANDSTNAALPEAQHRPAAIASLGNALPEEVRL